MTASAHEARTAHPVIVYVNVTDHEGTLIDRIEITEEMLDSQGCVDVSEEINAAIKFVRRNAVAS